MAAVLVAGNGQPVDEDFEKAVNSCALSVFAQQIKANAIDPMQHGAAYDEARERCRKAIGSLLEY